MRGSPFGALVVQRGAVAAIVGLLVLSVAALGRQAVPTKTANQLPPRINPSGQAPVDAAALNAVARSHSSDFGSSANETGTLYKVPAGKRLVIETVSCMATTATGIHLSGSIGTRLGTTSCSTQVAFQLVGSTDSYRRFAFNHPVKLYADAGTNVTFNMIRSGSASQGGYTTSFSGYLVDRP